MEILLKPYINASIDKNDKFTIDKLKPIISEFTLFKDISDYFPNIEELAFTEILTNLIFYQFAEDQIILNKGDKINGIYMILTGEISIYNGEEDEHIIEDKNELKNEYNKKFMRRKNIFNSIYDINFLPNSILNPGESLGYLQNNTDINISNKIIQATKQSILGYINYSTFNRIIKELKSLDSGQIIPFMKSLNLFANMNNFIEKLRLYTIQKRYQKDSYIFQEGDNYKTFYIIKKGVVNISVKIKKTTKSLIEPELLIGNINKIKLTGSKQNELKGFYVENFDYNLVKLSTGETIGDIEYYKNYPFYLYSAKCISPVDILEINLKKFIYLAKKCGDNLSKYHNKINLKINFFKNRIKDINKTIKKVNLDTQRRDIYTKIFLNNNVCKNVEENEKFINSVTNPMGKIIKKYKSLKMSNNLNNITPNYLSILETKHKYFSAKMSKNKRNNKFLFQAFKKKKNKLNSRNKLLENSHFRKITNFLVVRNSIRQKSNISLLIKKKDKINEPFQNRTSKMENFEIEKINKDINELSGIDESKKKSFVNVFISNYKNEHSSRDKALFNKKLKHNFLMENRRNSINKTFKDSSNSLFHLTNPFKSSAISYNHIY